MRLRYNYRLDPAPSHRIAFGKAFGCARVVFNDALRTRQQAQEAGLPYVADAEVSVRLTAAKRAAGRAWLSDVSAVVLQQALADLNAAHRPGEHYESHRNPYRVPGVLVGRLG